MYCSTSRSRGTALVYLEVVRAWPRQLHVAPGTHRSLGRCKPCTAYCNNTASESAGKKPCRRGKTRSSARRASPSAHRITRCALGRRAPWHASRRARAIARASASSRAAEACRQSSSTDSSPPRLLSVAAIPSTEATPHTRARTLGPPAGLLFTCTNCTLDRTSQSGGHRSAAARMCHKCALAAPPVIAVHTVPLHSLA